MSSDENARQHQDAMQLMLGRNAEAFLPLYEGRAAMNRERASQTRIPLLRWFYVRRARAAGIRTRIGNHASTRTTQLYDRRSDEVSLDEVERILI